MKSFAFILIAASILGLGVFTANLGVTGSAEVGAAEEATLSTEAVHLGCQSNSDCDWRNGYGCRLHLPEDEEGICTYRGR